MIRAKDGTDVRFDYVMTKVGASWLVHDVVVDGVSLIENYRAQVAQVLRASSYAGLVARLSPEPPPEARPRLGSPRTGLPQEGLLPIPQSSALRLRRRKRHDDEGLAKG